MRPVAGADPLSIYLDQKHLLSTPIAPECRMFKVHQQLRQVNEKAYEPAVLAIGPYNHHKDCLAFMEKKKLHYLQSMLESKNESSVQRLQTYIVALIELEERARGCYAECFSLDKDEIAKMMLLDGCFIVELFHKHYAVQNQRDKYDPILDKRDPIFQTIWMLNSLTRDLLLFENQLPFFVLTKLFEMTKVPTDTHGIIDLVQNFFQDLLSPLSLHFGQSSYDCFQNVDHLLSLIHRYVCSSGFVEIEMHGKKVLMEKDCTSMPCATKLQAAGVKFKNLEGANSLFDIKFNKGIMEIPWLKISDRTDNSGTRG